MRIEGRNTGAIVENQAAVVSPTGATTPLGHAQNDSTEVVQSTAAPATGAPMSELDAFANELRTVTRTWGDFPELVEGRQYGLGPDGFSVAFSDAIARARAHGITKPRDFVLGEIAVNLGRARLGYQRTDYRIKDNTALRLVVELTECVAAARAMGARYPAVKDVVQTYMTSMWSAVAERTKASGAPESVRAFVLTCLARAMGDSKSLNAKLDEHPAKVVDAAAALFGQLTEPPSVEEQKRLDTERGDADRAAAKRVDAVRDQLYPYFGELIMLSMPKATESKTEAKSLVSAEEALAANKERVAKREQSAKAAADVDARAQQDAEHLLSAIRRREMSNFWRRADRPTPSELRETINSLVTSGTITEPQHIDRTIEIALRDLSRRAQTNKFGAAARVGDRTPWSFEYMRPLAGPNMVEVLSAKTAMPHIDIIEAPMMRGRLSGMGGIGGKRDKGSSEAKRWVEDNHGRVATLRDMAKLAEGLSKHNGVTAEIARHLHSVQNDILSAFDECRRVAEKLDRAFEYRDARDFAEARSRFEGLDQKHEQIVNLLRSISVDGGGISKLLRFATGESKIDASTVLAGIEKVNEAQAGARAYLAECFNRYSEETAELARVLAPRLDWFDVAVKKTNASRQSDPLLPLFDSAWLGNVTAELKRAELAAEHIVSFVDGLPSEVREQVKVEIESLDVLKRALVEDASIRLAERLTGQAVEGRPSSGLEVAAVQSRSLPALAARPRLAFICGEQKLEPRFDEVREIEQLGNLGFRDASGRSSYAILSEQTRETEIAAAARADYTFWCRTFDLNAPASSFISELLGWRTYHASRLQKIVTDVTAAAADDDFSRSLNDANQLGQGRHPIEDLTGDALGAIYTSIGRISQRLTTSDRAIDDLAKYLDASTQPVNVLVHAASELKRARDTNKATALISKWLQLPDARLRTAARNTLMSLRGVTLDKVFEDQLNAPADGVEKLLALQDIRDSKSYWAIGSLVKLTNDNDGVIRAFATYALANLANDSRPEANDAANVLVELLNHADTTVVQFAADGLLTACDIGNSFAAKRIVDWSAAHDVTDPRVLDLVRAIADSGNLANGVTIEARGLLTNLEEKLKGVGITRPRRVVIKKAKTAKPTQRDIADVIVSAARSLGSQRDLDAVSDRVKLGLRLAAKFEQWSMNVRPELRPLLAKLDFPELLVDDAIAELSGKRTIGHLSKSPELVSELMSTPGFSAAEVAILESGALPPALASLTASPLAQDGSWRTMQLSAAMGDADRFSELVQLKLALSPDMPSTVGEVISVILDSKTERANAEIAYTALTNILSCDIPVLDPRLSDDERKKAIDTAAPLDPTVDGLVERAVVERLALVDAASSEAKLLVEYLASGPQELAERRLSSAMEHATSVPQAQIILDACRSRIRTRVVGPGKQKTPPWLVGMVLASPRLTVQQVVVVRDAMAATRSSSEPASVARAAERVSTLATAILDVRENIPAEQLEPLLAILADSEDDRTRLSKIDALKELMRGGEIEWSKERITAVRHGLLVVQANHRYGDIGAAFEQAIDFAGRVLTASEKLPVENLAKLFEIFARCGSSQSRTTLSDAIFKMYRTLEPRGTTLSLTMLQDIGNWLASADSASYSDIERKREVILNGVADLLPLPEAALTQLASSCAALGLQRTTDILRACKEHKRQAQLTADDVQRIVAKGASTDETPSLFRQMLGAAVGLTMWKPSSMGTLTDPLKIGFNDAPEIERAKRELRRSIGDIFGELAAPTGEKIEVKAQISNTVGMFALGAWANNASESRNSDPATAALLAASGADVSRLVSNSDLAQHYAAAGAARDAARDRMLDGKHPIEKMGALMMPYSREMATALDSIFSKTVDSAWELAAQGPRIHAGRFVQANIQRIAHKKMCEAAEAAGEAPPPAFVTPPYNLTPVQSVNDDRMPRILFVLHIDVSDSTKSDNRLGYFKQLAVLCLNGFGLTKNVKIDSAVVKFSDTATLIMTPAQQHDMRTMVQVLGPLNPERSTNAVDSLVKGRSLGKPGDTYDVVIHCLVTDGQPNSVPNTISTVEAMRKEGHIVLGLGVGPDTSFLSTIFGSASSVAESDPSRVAARSYHLLKEQVANAINKH